MADNAVGFAKKANVEAPQLGGGIITNPLHMPAALVNRTLIYYKSAIGVINVVDSASPPGFVTASITTTAKTNLCRLTGAGVLTHFISANCFYTTTQHTVTITVDGVEYALTCLVNASTGYLYVIGAFLAGGYATTSAAATTSNLSGVGLYFDGGHRGKSNGKQLVDDGVVILPTSHQVASAGLPRLRFEKSLSIDVQMSNAADVTGGSELIKARCAYLLD